MFIIQNFEQPALALKTEFALKFFTVLKSFLFFRIFEQLELALNFSTPPRTPLNERMDRDRCSSGGSWSNPCMLIWPTKHVISLTSKPSRQTES